MGNRAIITTDKRELGVYLHWNGGYDSVSMFLRYCEMKGYPSPDRDGYGFARLCQVIGNFFGGSNSLGIVAYTEDEDMNPGDNGIYFVRDWKVARHIKASYDANGFTGMRNVERAEEREPYDIRDYLHGIDEMQPENEKLGDYIDAEEVDTKTLKPGDVVYIQERNGNYRKHRVGGYYSGEVFPNCVYCEGLPWVEDAYGRTNSNSYIRTPTVRLASRA